MKTVGLIIVLLLIVCTTGCAPSTVAGLKRKAPPVVLTTEENYQSVHKRLKKAIENGIFGGLWLAENNTQSELYPDLGLGEISVKNNSIGGRSVFGHCIVEKIDGRTKVTAYCDSCPAGQHICEIIKDQITRYRNR